MAKNQGTYKFGVEFNVNQNSLNNVKKALADLKKMSKEDIAAAGGKVGDYSSMVMKSKNNDLGAMRKEIDNLGKALEAAYNPKLNTYELNKFNQALEQSGTSAQRVFQVVNDYGNAGKAALLDMTTNMLAVDRAAKQTNSTFQKLGETMMNTVRWSITSNALNTVTGAIQKAYYYTLDLDKSLNNIMIVTDKSSEEMQKFAREANAAAKALGKSTTEYTDASLIYYQQGLSDKDVKARTDVTLKAAAVTGQSTEAVSEQLTAVWNGYKVSAEESELYIDKLAAVAATTAADLEELSTGMSRVASAANVMGVDVDQLNAQLATIVSVTREAPESVGTALKTVYARMSDIEAGLDTETTLGEYTQQMAQMGINVLDANGKLRDMGAVVEEIGGKWNSLNKEQQISLAQSIAGTRQYSRMMSLFDNWEMYEEALETSANAAGALSKQHLTYLDSIEASQNRLKASAEGLYDSIFDSEQIKVVYNTLSGIVTLVDELVQSMGGMPGIIAAVAMIFAKSAKQSIANLITTKQENILNNERNKMQLQHGRILIENLREQHEGNKENIKYLDKIIELEEEIYNKAQNLTGDQWKNLQDGVKQYSEEAKKTLELQTKLRNAQKDLEVGKEAARGSSTQFKSWTEAGEEGKGRSYKLGTAQGRAAAQKYADKLRKQADGKDTSIAKAKIAEAEAIERAIKAAQLNEKELEELEKKIKDYADEAENAEEKTDNFGESLKDAVDKDNFANKITEITDKLTTMGFTVMTVSSSVGNITEAIKSGEGTIQDYFGGLIGVIGPLIPMFTKATKAAWTAGAAVKATGTAAKVAGEGVKAFLGSFGAIGWITIVLTLLTSVITAMQKIKEAQIEANKTAIEKERELRAELQATTDLTKAYEEAYTTYKKNNQVTEELQKTAVEVAEALEDEELKVLALTHRYDELSDAITKANNKRTIAAGDSARKQQNQAKALLESQGISDVNGIGASVGKWFADIGAGLFGGGLGTIAVTGATGVGAGVGAILTTVGAAGTLAGASMGVSTSRISYGAELEEEEVKNKELLQKYLGEYYQEGPNGMVEINWPETAGQMVDFYTRLEEATLDKKWDSSSGNEINKNVQKILADEELKEGVEAYLESQDLINKAFVQEKLGDNFGKEAAVMDLSSFNAKKQSLIDELRLEDPTLEPEEAEAIVEAQMAAAGEDAAMLVKRGQTAKAYSAEGSAFEGRYDDLVKAFDTDSISDTVFNSLGTVDSMKYMGKENGIEEWIEAVRAKVKQQQEELWANESDARLENLDYRLENLEKEGDKATGKAKLDILKQQNEVLEAQLAILEKVNEVNKNSYIDQQQSFLDLLNSYSLSNMGLAANGDSWNFEYIKDTISKNLDSGFIDEDASNALLTSLIKLQDASNKYQEGLQGKIEKQWELYEKKLEDFDLQIEIELVDSEITKAINEMKRVFLEDEDFKGTAELLISDLSASAGAIGVNKNALAELEEQLKNGQIELADFVERYEKHLDSTVEGISEYKDLLKQIEELQVQALESVNEQFGKQIDALDNINSLYEKQISLTQLIYGDTSYKRMAASYKNMLSTQEDMLESNERSLLYWEGLYNEVMADPDKFSKEYVNTVIENYAAAGSAVVDTVAQIIETAQKDHMNNMEIAIQEFEEKMANGRTLEGIKSEWEWIKSSDEKYLDAIEGAFALGDLDTAFKKSLSSTTNIKDLELINKLRAQEMEYLKSKEKLTKTDLDRAQTRLKILEAEIALENAQSSATEMRLTRMADGSYSYQYVADLDSIASKQEELSKANQELYNLDKEAYQANLDEFYAMYEEYIAKVKAAYADGMVTDEEAAELTRYKEKITELADENKTYQENLAETTKEMANKLGIEILEDINSTSSGLQTMIDNIGKELENEEGQINTALDTMLDSIAKSATDYAEKIEAAEQKAESAIDKTKDTYVRLNEQADKRLKELIGEDGKGGEVKAITDLAAGYGELHTNLSNVVTDYGNLGTNIDTLAQAYERLKLAKQGLEDEEGPSPEESDTGGSDVSTYSAEKLKAHIQSYITAHDISYDSSTENLNRSMDRVFSSGTAISRESYDYWNGIEDKENAFNWYDIERDFKGDFAGGKLKDTDNYVTSSNSDEAYFEVTGGTIYDSNGNTVSRDYKLGLWDHQWYSNFIYEDKDGNKYRLAKRPFDPSDMSMEKTYFIPLSYTQTADGNKKITYTTAFDTGGYTGDWNSSEGRLATLHEKEIVLNKADTANILKAVDIVRSLETSMLSNLAQLNVVRSSSMDMFNPVANTELDQTVHITAEFPNVSVKAEIEEAFAELVNLATQYIHQS